MLLSAEVLSRYNTGSFSHLTRRSLTGQLASQHVVNAPFRRVQEFLIAFLVVRSLFIRTHSLIYNHDHIPISTSYLSLQTNSNRKAYHIQSCPSLTVVPPA